MRNFLCVVLACILLSACTTTPSNVRAVIRTAGDNSQSLEKVIKHYSDGGNEEKLQAAYFLLGNMQEKFSYTGEAVAQFDPLFGILDSLYRGNVKMLTESPVVKAKWDSITDIYGLPSLREAEKAADNATISSDMLIENIDYSYRVWKSCPWNKPLSFAQYCEFLLPYRIGTERLEPWMKYLSVEYKPFRDTVQAKNSFLFAQKLDALLRKKIGLNHTIDKYPFEMTARQMEQARRGACKHLVDYEIMVMRANGIPVSHDFTPQWGDAAKGHEWLALIDGKKKPYPFNAVQEDFQGFFKNPYRFAKVYRRAFAKQKNIRPSDDADIPQNLFDGYAIDVTAEYNKTADITLGLQYAPPFNGTHAILCTYGDRWTPQSWGTIKGNSVTFRNMGTDIMYMAMYFHQGKLYPATKPFVASGNGTIRFVATSQEKQSVVLERKYPYINLNYRNAVCFLKGKLQGANRKDFADAADLYTVTKVPTMYVDVVLRHPGMYRYARYIPSKGQKTNLAELEFYGLNRKTMDTVRLSGAIDGYPIITKELGTPFENAFDGKPQTYFSGNKDSVSWAGMDFGSRQPLVKIRYCPRSDTNFMLVGDVYELYVWQKDQWLSLGKQRASSQALAYQNVPKDGLFLLRDLSQGSEQRIFTYERNKQVWW